jgi:hypothetical protein
VGGTLRRRKGASKVAGELAVAGLGGMAYARAREWAAQHLAVAHAVASSKPR